MVAPGPFNHGPYCSSCSPAAGWSGLGRFQQGDNLSLETAQTRSSSPLAGVSTSIAQGRRHGAGCGAEARDGLQDLRRRSQRQLRRRSQSETVAALTRHCRTHAPPQGARRRSPTTTVPLGTSTTPWYAPSPSFWSTWGRPKQDFCASLRTQPRATRANRAQSTANH